MNSKSEEEDDKEWGRRRGELYNTLLQKCIILGGIDEDRIHHVVLSNLPR